MSMLLSQFAHPLLPLLCPQVHSLCLHLHAAMNTGVHVSFWVVCFLGYMQAEEKVTYKGIALNMTVGFSIASMALRRQWNNVFKMLIVDNCQIRIMDPVKPSLKHESEIKTFSDFLKNRVFHGYSHYKISKRYASRKRKFSQKEGLKCKKE